LSAVNDARIQAAIGHWAPRLIANGIDYNDFVTTTARISRWAEWCAEWSKTAAKHERLAQEAEARGSTISAADSYVRCRALLSFRQVRLPRRHGTVPQGRRGNPRHLPQGHRLS
jgi:hypothetical protein